MPRPILPQTARDNENVQLSPLPLDEQSSLTEAGETDSPGSLPGPSSGPSSGTIGPPPAIRRAARQTAIRVACFACRKRRSKCDGNRPVCGYCITKDTADSCGYETEESGSRIEQMRQKIRDLEAEVRSLQAALAVANSSTSSTTSLSNDTTGNDTTALNADSSVSSPLALSSAWQVSPSPIPLSPSALSTFSPFSLDSHGAMTVNTTAMYGATRTERADSRSAASADGVLRIGEMMSPDQSSSGIGGAGEDTAPGSATTPSPYVFQQ